MSVSDFIVGRLEDLLDKKRVVVWYDTDAAFKDLASRFPSPQCVVVDASESILIARREADRVYGCLDEGRHTELCKHLLIYCPRARGQTEEERYEDPFEVFALLGASFGDQPEQTLHSLTRQALPDRTGEVDRLFREGHPTLALMDGLKAGASYPLLKDFFGTDSPPEVVARLVCVPGTAARLAGAPGAGEELLRLLAREYGFAPSNRAAKLESKLEHLGTHLLLSEFAFDLAEPLPEALANLPVAPASCKDAVFALCDRMRRSDDTRDGYIELAGRAETTLHLRELYQEHGSLGARDTFPFEERRQLRRVQKLAGAGKLAEARLLIEVRRQSVWSNLGERAVLWKLTQRCLDLLETVEACRPNLADASRSVREHVLAYTDAERGLWRIDRQQRLVEQGASLCPAEGEVESLVEMCRRGYAELAGDAQARFLAAVGREGWPPEGVTRQTQVFDRHVAPALQEGGKVAYFLVDALRYEMGRDLGAALEGTGSVKVEVVATVLPTTTPFGMAALMPGADGTFKLVEQGGELVPAVADQPLAGSAERMAFLRTRLGDRFAEMSLGQLLSAKEKKLAQQVGQASLFVVRTPEMDSLGETMSLYQARKHMSGVLGELVMAADRLVKLGFQRFVFAADHGHVLLPEVPAGDVIPTPPGKWALTKRRCCLGAGTQNVPGVLVLPTAKCGIVSPVAELAVARGFRVFAAGEAYFHEGISLQECLIPVVTVSGSKVAEGGKSGHEIAIRYRSDSFTSRVIGIRVWFNSLLDETLVIRLEAYDGTGPRAALVADAADCDARDPVTGLVTLERGKETQVPLRLHEDFSGRMIEVRAVDAAGAVLDRKPLKNALLI